MDVLSFQRFDITEVLRLFLLFFQKLIGLFMGNADPADRMHPEGMVIMPMGDHSKIRLF